MESYHNKKKKEFNYKYSGNKLISDLDIELDLKAIYHNKVTSCRQIKHGRQQVAST